MALVRNAEGGWTKNQADDEYETPVGVLRAMISVAPGPVQDMHIWEPFVCSGHAGQAMRSLGARVTETTTDFFETDPPQGTNIVISNPPFSNKKGVLRRLCELNMPFILVVPVTTASYAYTRKLVHEFGDFHVVFPPKIVRFLKNGQLAGRPPFYSIFLCHGIPPPPCAWLPDTAMFDD